MSQYAEFDKVLLAAIAAGKHSLHVLEHNAELRKAVPSVALGKPYFRVIDARLQALRKAGKIEYVTKTWRVKA